MDSELSTVPIRFFLFADVLADLLQLETDRGHGVTTAPEMFSREVSLFAAQSGYGDGALPFEKPDHRSHRVLGGNRDTHMHVIRHQMAIQNLALFLPGQSMEDFSPVSARFSQQHLITTDGFKPYVDAVHYSLGTRADFAQLVKVYSTPRDDEQRYSAAKLWMQYLSQDGENQNLAGFAHLTLRGRIFLSGWGCAG